MLGFRHDSVGVLAYTLFLLGYVVYVLGKAHIASFEFIHLACLRFVRCWDCTD